VNLSDFYSSKLIGLSQTRNSRLPNLYTIVFGNVLDTSALCYLEVLSLWNGVQILPVLVQSRKSSSQHCAMVAKLMEGDMSPKNASFTGVGMQPVLNHSHFSICIFGDTTNSCQISLFYVPF
jgi:hypothetical protein